MGILSAIVEKYLKSLYRGPAQNAEDTFKSLTKKSFLNRELRGLLLVSYLTGFSCHEMWEGFNTK